MNLIATKCCISLMLLFFTKKLYFQLIWIFHLFNFEYIFKHIQTPANRSLKWYHPSLLPHHHNNNHNKIRWSAKAQPKLEMALALFLTHHSFKILSLTHICLHLLAYFFSFHFFILFSHFKNWNFAFTNTQLALYKAFTCHFVHALVIICERVCDCVKAFVFFFRR